MPNWLDSWTNTRYLDQQSLAKRWALRGHPEAVEAPLPATPPVVLPMEHSRYILKHGKKAYRRWMEMGCPDKMPDPSGICPVMTAYGEFLMQRKYGVWRPRADGQSPPPSPKHRGWRDDGMETNRDSTERQGRHDRHLVRPLSRRRLQT